MREDGQDARVRGQMVPDEPDVQRVQDEEPHNQGPACPRVGVPSLREGTRPRQERGDQHIQGRDVFP